MKEKSKNRLKLLSIILFVFSFFLQGCFAPALLPAISAASMAMGGFQMYKGVQLTTGGTAEIRFADNKVSEEDRKALAEIKSIGIYPGTQDNIMLADAMAEKKRFKIVTPYTIEQALNKKGKYVHFESLAEFEKVEKACQVCKVIGADSILLLRASEGGTTANIYSLKRAEAKAEITAVLYSAVHKRKVWSQDGELVLKVGANSPAEKEVGQLIASAVTDKFMEAMK